MDQLRIIVVIAVVGLVVLSMASLGALSLPVRTANPRFQVTRPLALRDVPTLSTSKSTPVANVQPAVRRDTTFSCP